MTSTVRRIGLTLSASLVIVTMVGCGQPKGTPGGPGSGAPSSTTPGTASPQTPASAAPVSPGPQAPPPPPEQTISYGPGAAPESGTGEPARTPQSAATADGPLDEQSLPRDIAGFTAETAEPSEGEFTPNGTWVYAVQADQAGGAALPRCGPAGSGAPVAHHALAAKYAADGGRTGNGLVLQFPDERAATIWYGEFVRQLRSCSTDLTAGETQFTDRRRVDGGAGEVAETGRLRGDRVLLIALSTDASGPDLGQLGRELAEFTG